LTIEKAKKERVSSAFDNFSMLEEVRRALFFWPKEKVKKKRKKLK
jgi:hypothetical protein